MSGSSVFPGLGPLAVAALLVAGGATAQDAAAPVGKPNTPAAHRPVTAAPPGFSPPARDLIVAAKPDADAPIDLASFHHDDDRAGWTPRVTDFTLGDMASGKFGMLQTMDVDRWW